MVHEDLWEDDTEDDKEDKYEQDWAEEFDDDGDGDYGNMTRTYVSEEKDEEDGRPGPSKRIRTEYEQDGAEESDDGDVDLCYGIYQRTRCIHFICKHK